MCITWCQSVGLIKTSVFCTKCCSNMILYLKEHQLRCCRNQQTVKISIRNNTWFQNAKISFEKIIVLTYMFSIGNTKYTDIIRESSKGDKISCKQTIADWLSYCRKICLIALDKHYDNEGQIGGEAYVVQIDETKIGKRKYNKGRSVKGQWVVGMLDIGSQTVKKCSLRLEMCKDNKIDSKTL